VFNLVHWDDWRLLVLELLLAVVVIVGVMWVVRLANRDGPPQGGEDNGDRQIPPNERGAGQAATEGSNPTSLPGS
jgi:hypothetical protein